MNADKPVDTEALSLSWTSELGDALPLGNDLRRAQPARWARFHFLPGAQRVVRTEGERAEVLHRFHSLLAELGSNSEPQLLVITCGWGSRLPAPRPPDLAQLLPAVHWLDIPPGPSNDVAASVYVTSIPSQGRSDRLEELLTDWIADASTTEVIIAPPSFDWLAHPYDGGMDVIARSEGERDALAAAFSDWLSPHPDGL